MTSVLARPIWLALTYAFTALTWSVAASVWSRGENAIAASVFTGGLSLGPCLAGYLSAPKRYKQLRRRTVLVTGGLSILALLASTTNLEPESFAVAEYASAGRRATSGERILCQRCAYACPNDTLRLTLGFDVAGRTSFAEPRSPRPAPKTANLSRASERSAAPCR